MCHIKLCNIYRRFDYDHVYVYIAVHLSANKREPLRGKFPLQYLLRNTLLYAGWKTNLRPALQQC